MLLLFHFLVFLWLSLLHFYWALGGSWGMEGAVPTDGNGRKIFRPTAGTTLAVAIGLMAFAWLNLACFSWAEEVAGTQYICWALRGIGAIFLLRAIGDFRYIGFLKRYRKTAFSRKDTWIYSPLSLLLSISHFIITGSF